MLYTKLGRPALSKTMTLVAKSVAEEILQDIFTKMWHGKIIFPTLRHAYAWVYKCCTNAAIDHIRNHNNSHAELTDFSSQDFLNYSDNNLERSSEAHDLWKKLVLIFDSEESAVFVYRNIDGLTQDEVAEVMQISRRTVNRIQDRIDEKIEKIRRQHDVR